MNYRIIYENLISTARRSNRTKTKAEYYEEHHILPRCLGGDDSKDNLVLLTAREHFIVHRLLCKIYPGSFQLKLAVLMMASIKRDNTKVTSRNFERLKMEISEARKSRSLPERCIEFDENLKVPVQISNKLRGIKAYKSASHPIKKTLSLLITNLLLADILESSITYPRSPSSSKYYKKVSIYALLRAEEILVQMGFVDNVEKDSTSPLSKRKRCAVWPCKDMKIVLPYAESILKLNKLEGIA